MTWAATHLDGTTAAPRGVTLAIDAQRGMLVGDGIAWPLETVRAVPDQAARDLLVLRCADDPVQRLIVADRTILARLPRPHARSAAPWRGRLAAWSVAALASVATILFLLVPALADRLAALIPPEGERALGEVTLRQVREALDDSGMRPVPFCEAPPGRAAIATMTKRFKAAMDDPPPLTVHVLDHGMVNAFALPGGHVILFRGLIATARSPDEVAAVLAHEIGHAVSRDPTRHALRSAGSIGILGLVFGDFAGGTLVLFLAERLIDAQYSREAEAQADLFAHALMRDAGMDPAALASLFDRLADEGGEAPGLLAHFSSHPELGDRVAAARAAPKPAGPARPALTDAQWRALRAVCD